MRGDPPFVRVVSPSSALSTPHARGSTVSSDLQITSKVVYPACAGIHLIWRVRAGRYCSLPRMRGDPPEYVTIGNEKE